jgi:NAD(P)-dependent dehydrogenase (short-subunit alcohol dehydrogenase family)
MKKSAIVTGASRGIGKQVVKELVQKGFNVIAVARSEASLRDLTAELGPAVTPYALDITKQDACDLFQEYMESSHPRIDVLVNNAGIMGNNKTLAFDLDQMRDVLETNLLGAVRITKAAWHALCKSSDARVINVSSGMGSTVSMQDGGYAAYRLSKWSLNGWTMLLAAEAPKNVSVYAVCPGWVRTDMGGPNAPRTVEQGADSIVWLATESGLPSGTLWKDKQQVHW